MFGTCNAASLIASLNLLWQGMLGIFAVMLFIMLVVKLFTKFTKK